MLNATSKRLWGSCHHQCRPLQCISALSPPAAVRYGSLSSIHRGLRRSERVQFGETRSSKSRGSDRSKRSAEDFIKTFKALDGASSDRQQHKLRKKLDRKASDAEDEDENGRRTRRKRFLDPEFSFGKRSLVYQLKHGSLKDAAASIKLQEPVRPRQWSSKNDEAMRDSFRDRPFRQPRRQLARDDAPQRDQPWPDQSRNDRPRRDQARDDLPQRDQSWRDQPRSDQQRDHHRVDSIDEIINSAKENAAVRPSNLGMMPMAMPYTTAASQFLYGKSVVKAALEQGRRQLYKLYIYGGENRRDSKDNDAIINLARIRGVPVTIVPNEDQRLMDKMSMGRPHNGFVLETSPLPQLPVVSLGQVEESPSRLGFHVKLDYQSAEQKSINGQDSFVRKARNGTSKPMVLLLHEILDPGNLGAILRTASYMGVDAVGITSRGSSSLTPVVLKSAAGAAEEVTILTVDSPIEFLTESRAMGWKTYSAVAPPEKKLIRLHGDKFISTDDVERKRPLDQHPCVLVLGNEGYGLPRHIKVATDFELSVPKFVQDSSVDSLNVSVAAGLLCHSFVKKESATRTVDGAAAVSSRKAVSTVKTADGNGDDLLF